MTALRNVLFLIVVLPLGPRVHAGVFFTAQSLDEDDITHPIGYRGSGTDLTVDVCISPGLPNAVRTPVRNAIDRFNLLVPTVGNVRSGVTLPNGGALDFESVLVHEIGHCVGLGHVNLASESGLTGTDQDYTSTTRGRNLLFDLDDGSDNVIGSPDDRRRDDENLHWFFEDVNNPFVLPDQPDEDNYSRDLRDLPTGDDFAANGDFTVGQDIFGIPNTEAVMQQGTFQNEVQRSLAADDVATLLFARTGLDQEFDTRDDYTVTLNYRGVSTSSTCDIQIQFQADTFAFCAINTANINRDHTRITAAAAVFGSDVDWAFETERVPLPVVDEATVTIGGTTATLNNGDTELTENDLDQEGSGLVVSETIAFPPDHGSAILNTDGTFSYTHNGDNATEDRFVYEVCSGDSFSCTHQYVAVTIVPNGEPEPMADIINVPEGGTATRLRGGADSVLDNDADPEGDPLVVARIVSDVQFGTLDLLEDGTFSYDHDGSQNLSDSFVYEVCDDRVPPACATQSVSIDIANVNDAPILDPPAPNRVIISEDNSPTAFQLALTAVDPDGDPIVWSTATMTPGAGQASVDTTGVVDYSPPADFFGTDTLTVEFSDGSVDDEVAVLVEIQSVNDAPSFVATSPPSVLSTIGTVTIDDWIESASPGPANESNQSITYQINSLQDPAMTLDDINISADGQLRYRTSGNGGTVNFEVTAMDNGGTSNGGVEVSPPQDFTLIIIADEPPMLLQSGPFRVSAEASIGAAVADIDANDGNGGAIDEGISYRAIGGNATDLFLINPATGEITVTDDLRGLVGQTVTLDVEVSDGEQTTVTTVQLHIEEAPIFRDGFE